MNPGYAGRTELPDSLKVLFRPVTVIAPDLNLICENMLMAEGFLRARELAKKFISLFRLSSDLLSKASHYDWGLRAVKSLLVAAGSLRRTQATFDEEVILMRALRDFNLPKIVAQDVPVFQALVADLFPTVKLSTNGDSHIENLCKVAVASLGLVADPGTIQKCNQLSELLQVRHCVFVLGGATTGKSSVIRTLLHALPSSGCATSLRDINPKTVSAADLYGYTTVAKEWREGLLTGIMRDLTVAAARTVAGKTSALHCIVLDGDLDTNWIESMNSVMDDNKVLTLANHERIILHPTMRLLFEIADVTYATPATVSRAGILYFAASDIGWSPLVVAKNRSHPHFRLFMQLFDRYVPPTLDFVTRELVCVLPFTPVQVARSICALIAALLPPQADFHEKEIEMIFTFVVVWSFGGMLPTGGSSDARMKFDRWWRKEWRSARFPAAEIGTVFDFFLFFSDATI